MHLCSAGEREVALQAATTSGVHDSCVVFIALHPLMHRSKNTGVRASARHIVRTDLYDQNDAWRSRPAMAKREPAPRGTGLSATTRPPCSAQAVAASHATSATTLAASAAAGNAPSALGMPSGKSQSRRGAGESESLLNRIADHVSHGTLSKTPRHRSLAAMATTASATESMRKSWL